MHGGWKSRLSGHSLRLLLGSLAASVCLWTAAGTALRAQDAPAGDQAAAKNTPIGQFLSVSGSVDDTLFGRVNRAALALQTRAQQEQRQGILVLEILPGSSPFHQILGLARFLSSEVPGLTTVAWIPEKLTGHHVILALACQEIVMHPQAEMGDISLGTPLPPEEQAFVVNLVNRRHNRHVNEALALGLLDRQKEVLWVQLELGQKPNVSRESRVVSRNTYDDLARAGTQILDVKTIKEAGSPGVFTGERAHGYNILAANTAPSREDVARLYHLPREAMRESAATGEAPRSVIIRIDDMIEPILEQFVIRQIDRAVGNGVNLIIFEIDSPGGYALTSMQIAEAIADLDRRKIRTVAYVPKRALSGAAIIALGCDEIYLHGDALIGDAGGIELGAGGQFEFVPQKLMEPLERHLENMAARKHRPPALLVAMMNKDLEVFAVTHRDNGRVTYLSDEQIQHSNGEWIKGLPVPEAGRDQLLTLNGRRAHELQLADPPVRDFDELKARLGIPQETTVPVSSRTWVDSLIFLLNTGWAMTLLCLLGLLGIYLELHFPSGMFGIMSCVCFALFFWGRFLGGTAGWLEVVLFLLGVGCIALEVFVVPGFGVFGVSGVLLCAFSLILATQTFVIPHSQSDMGQLARSTTALFAAITAMGIIALATSRFLPRISLFRDMVLVPPNSAAAQSHEPQLRPDLLDTPSGINPVLERDQALIGRQGTSVTVLRPAGKARIGEDYVDVISEGPFISVGREIEVVSVSGNRVVVREVS